MIHPTTPFKLHAPNLSADAQVKVSDDLPVEVAGQPATYLWKDMIHSGNYVHPSRDFSLAVDRNRLEKWAATGQKMIAAGLAVPINCDHSDSARDVVGYVKEFKLDGDRLLGLCQFIGEDAALTAARNLVSVGVDPDFTDGHGEKWGEAIVHLALTPVPVVPDQDQFVKTEEELEDDDEPEVEDEEEPSTQPSPGDLRSAVPGEGEEDREPELLNLSAAVQPVPPLTVLRPSALRPRLEEGRVGEAVRSEPIIATNEARGGNPPPLRSPGVPGEGTREFPQEIESAMAELATTKFDLAVERGSISPIARDRLLAALVRGGDGKPNVLTLSRGSGPGASQSLAVAVAEILLDSGPVQIGEATGLQAMSRQIPGEEASPIDQLRQYMTKIASVSG
jgi:hypothetical protein